MLWRKDELQSLFGLDVEASGVAIDTRSLKKGDLFFGLVGENGVDGMKFAPQAIEAGAAAVTAGLDNLERLGAAARDRNNGQRIAVTGSVGKTTTKELLATAFAALGRTHAATASFNNHIGVPLTLARMPRDTKYGIFEIGMNHIGEIAPLARQVRPHAAIITTIAPVHLEHMGSLETIADEKADVFTGMHSDGIAILPADSAQIDRLTANIKNRGIQTILTFGLSESANARLLSTDVQSDAVYYTADINGTRVTGSIPLAGAHIAGNAMAVLAVVQALGGDVHKAAKALERYAPLAGRGARFSAGGVNVLDESYNGSPASMRATLHVLAALPSKGRRVAIFGDMFELGDTSPVLHASLADTVANLPVDQVITCGPTMQNLHDALPMHQRGPHFTDSAAVAAAIPDLLRPDDSVLIKGSLGMKMKTIVEAIRNL
jgi:UDP-N-acetylmuramoyl-tripeptide--D-alanyl-D-alanine ligase